MINECTSGREKVIPSGGMQECFLQDMQYELGLEESVEQQM